MSRVDFPTVIGAILGLFGLALVLETGISTALNISANATTAVAGLALIAALLTAQLAFGVDRSHAAVPDTETKAELPVPGADVDDVLAEIDANPLDTLDERDDLRARLTTIAVSVFTDQFGVRESVARDALEMGFWTDDPHAVAFFTGEYPDWASLRLQLRDRSTFTRTPPSMQAEHVVAELRAVKSGKYEQLDRAPVVPDEPDQDVEDESLAADGGQADNASEVTR